MTWGGLWSLCKHNVGQYNLVINMELGVPIAMKLVAGVKTLSSGSIVINSI